MLSASTCVRRGGLLVAALPAAAPDARVGLVTFSDQVTLIGDGDVGSEVHLAGSKLDAAAYDDMWAKGKAAAGNAKPVARHVRVRLVLAGGKPRASACLLVRPRTRLQRLLRSAERYLDVERSVQCVRVHGQHVDVTPTRRLRDLPRPKPDGELVIELDAS